MDYRGILDRTFDRKAAITFSLAECCHCRELKLTNAMLNRQNSLQCFLEDLVLEMLVWIVWIVFPRAPVTLAFPYSTRFSFNCYLRTWCSICLESDCIVLVAIHQLIHQLLRIRRLIKHLKTPTDLNTQPITLFIRDNTTHNATSPICSDSEGT